MGTLRRTCETVCQPSEQRFRVVLAVGPGTAVLDGGQRSPTGRGRFLGGFVLHFHNGKCHRIADGEMFPIHMRKLDNISVRQTYRWKARFMGFLLMYSVSTSTSGFMANYRNKNSESAKFRNLAATRGAPSAHQLHAVLPLIHARCHGIVLVQAAGFCYRKHGIYQYNVSRALPTARTAFRLCIRTLK